MGLWYWSTGELEEEVMEQELVKITSLSTLFNKISRLAEHKRGQINHNALIFNLSAKYV